MTASPEPHKPKLLDRVREVIRFKHFSRRTEETYVQWIKRFINFDLLAARSLSLSASRLCRSSPSYSIHRKPHPETMGAAEVTAFDSFVSH